jgi:acylphosphatase
MAVRAVRLVIEGRVQGVGYRYWTVEEARARGLDGWVRNLPDGTVEALVSGPSDAVEAMIAACREGPSLASVTAIREFPAEAPDASGFRQVW